MEERRAEDTENAEEVEAAAGGHTPSTWSGEGGGGSLRAVAESDVTIGTEPSPLPLVGALEHTKYEAALAISPRGSNPRTRTVAVMAAARRASVGPSSIAKPGVQQQKFHPEPVTLHPRHSEYIQYK